MSEKYNVHFLAHPVVFAMFNYTKFEVLISFTRSTDRRPKMYK